MVYSFQHVAAVSGSHAFELAACSREGAAIADAIVVLIKYALLAIVIVLAVAIVSGLVVGAKKGNQGRQVLVHVLWGTGLLIVLPVLIGVWITIVMIVEGIRLERNLAELEVWLAPLKQAPPGEFDRAIAGVLDAKGADSRDGRLQLISALPERFDRIDRSLDERERAALFAAVARLRTENEQRQLGMHPSNLDLLDGAAAWLGEKPDLVRALGTCNNHKECLSFALHSANRWCERNRDRCGEALTRERLAGADALVLPSDRETLDGLRRRAAELARAR